MSECRHPRRLFPEADPLAFTWDKVMPCAEPRCEASIKGMKFRRPVAVHPLGIRYEDWELRPGRDGWEWVITPEAPPPPSTSGPTEPE